MDETNKRDLMSKITNILAKENVAYDINGYPKAPPSFRIWGGGTVEPDDVRTLLPWIDWAYEETKIDLD
jgi:phosphoserine aminotransferase